MKYIHKIAATAATISLMAFSYAVPVMAATGDLTSPDANSLDQINDSAGLGGKNIYQIVGSLIKTARNIIGLIAICLVIYGGFKWMTAGGSEENVEEAKKILYSGAIGMVVIFSAYGLTKLVLDALSSSTGTASL